MNRKGPRIATWIVNGIVSKKREFFLNTQHIDICLISEIHMTSQSYIQIKRYEICHTIYPDHQVKGGSAIIINESINTLKDAIFNEYENELVLSIVLPDTILKKLSCNTLMQG